MPASSITSRIFGIDARSLAAFRIGMGGLLLVDLALRARDLKAHYTDAGILPREVIASRLEGTWNWSLHALSGSVTLQIALFALAALLAVLLTLGIGTRIATIGSWILLASLQERNHLVINGGDVLLRMLLLWAIFLPLDLRWSLSKRRRKADSNPVIVSVATGAVLLQVAIVYFMSGYFKYYGSWHSPDALSRILKADCYAKPVAYMLADYGTLLSVLSVAVVVSELVLPILIFSPVWTRPVRLFSIVWFAGFHLGIELTLTVGLFSYVSWLAWVLFVPASVWDRITKAPAAAIEAHSDPPSRFRQFGSVFTNAIAGLLLIYVVWYQVSTLSEPWAREVMPAEARRFGNLLGLRQKWNLFPRPLSRDGWYVAVARLRDGRTVDLLRHGEPADWESYRKPQYIYRMSANHRWRKMYRRLVGDGYDKYRAPLCRYLATEWNLSHPPESHVESIELHFMQEMGRDSDHEERYSQRFLCTIDFAAPG